MKAGINNWFDFCDWEKAFKAYYEEADSNKVLVISTHPYSSGYWVSTTTTLTAGDFLYPTKKDVEELEKRVRKQVDEENKKHRGAKLVL